jgi:hypothetical protein
VALTLSAWLLLLSQPQNSLSFGTDGQQGPYLSRTETDSSSKGLCQATHRPALYHLFEVSGEIPSPPLLLYKSLLHPIPSSPLCSPSIPDQFHRAPQPPFLCLTPFSNDSPSRTSLKRNFLLRELALDMLFFVAVVAALFLQAT